MRPRTATPRSRSDVRTRPVSAPSERAKGRRSPSARSTNHPIVLVPSLANVSNTTVNEISRAELEAWATLSQNRRRPHESRSAVTFGRARPNSAVEHHCHFSREGGTPGRGGTTTTVAPIRGVDMHRCNLEQFASGHNSTASSAVRVLSTPLPSGGNRNSGFRGTANGAHKRSSYRDGPEYEGCGRRTLVRDQRLDGCSMGRAGHDAEENQQDRADISVRCVAIHSYTHQ